MERYGLFDFSEIALPMNDMAHTQQAAFQGTYSRLSIGSGWAYGDVARLQFKIPDLVWANAVPHSASC
jgi:hypothetical protein